MSRGKRRIVPRSRHALLGAALAAVGLVAPFDPAVATLPATWTNPVIVQDSPDPFVLKASSGTYYAFTTNTGVGTGSYKRVPVWTGTSTNDFTTYGASSSDALPTRGTWENSTSKKVWAPSVLALSASSYVMYYTSTDNATGKQCIGYATATSAAGTYTPNNTVQYCGTNGNVGASVATSPGGTHYVVFGEETGTNKSILVDRLTSSGTPDGTFATDVIFTPSDWTTTVGRPSLVPIGGIWVLFYSGRDSSFGDGYAVQWATCGATTGAPDNCTTPTPPRPVLESTDWVRGPGSAQVFSDGTNLWLAYHAHFPRRVDVPDTIGVTDDGSPRQLRVDKLCFTPGEVPRTNAPTLTSQSTTRQSICTAGTTPDIPNLGWAAGTTVDADILGDWDIKSEFAVNGLTGSGTAQLFRGDAYQQDRVIEVNVTRKTAATSGSLYGLFALVQDGGNWIRVLLDEWNNSIKYDYMYASTYSGMQTLTSGLPAKATNFWLSSHLLRVQLTGLATATSSVGPKLNVMIDGGGWAGYGIPVTPPELTGIDGPLKGLWGPTTVSTKASYNGLLGGYVNPVAGGSGTSLNLPDPQIIRTGTQTAPVYYAFTSSVGSKKLPVWKSNDLVTWKEETADGWSGSLPGWVSGTTIASPAVYLQGSTYHLYYTATNSSGTRCLGHATSTSPGSGYTDGSGSSFVCTTVGGSDGAMSAAIAVESTSRAHLFWRSDTGTTKSVASRALTSTGTFDGATTTHTVFASTAASNWENQTIDQPAVTRIGTSASFLLAYSAGATNTNGVAVSAAYGTGWGTCTLTGSGAGSYFNTSACTRRMPGSSANTGQDVPLLGTYKWVTGPGNADFVTDPEGALWLGWNSNGGSTNRQLGVDRVCLLNDAPHTRGPSIRTQPLDEAAACDSERDLSSWTDKDTSFPKRLDESGSTVAGPGGTTGAWRIPSTCEAQLVSPAGTYQLLGGNPNEVWKYDWLTDGTQTVQVSVKHAAWQSPQVSTQKYGIYAQFLDQNNYLSVWIAQPDTTGVNLPRFGYVSKVNGTSSGWVDLGTVPNLDWHTIRVVMTGVVSQESNEPVTYRIYLDHVEKTNPSTPPQITLHGGAIGLTTTNAAANWKDISQTDGGAIDPKDSKLIAQETGCGSINNTERDWNVSGADYGLPFDAASGATFFAFGDTIAEPRGFGDHVDWRSSTLAYSNSSGPTGFVFQSGAGTNDGYVANLAGRAKELPYPPSEHLFQTGTGSEQTRVPIAGVHPSGSAPLYLYFMSVHKFSPWVNNNSQLWKSTDGGVNWTASSANWTRAGTSKFSAGTYTVGNDGWIYFYGTPAGRDGPLYVSRVSTSNVGDLSLYEYWNGTGWTVNNESVAASLKGPGGTTFPIGEFGVRYNSAISRYVLMYTVFPGTTQNKVMMRTSTSPTGPWSGTCDVITGSEYPQVYGGFMPKGSTSTDTYYMLSTSFNGTYNTYLMKTPTPASGGSCW